jgi:uncharacterized protein YceK
MMIAIAIMTRHPGRKPMVSSTNGCTSVPTLVPPGSGTYETEYTEPNLSLDLQHRCSNPVYQLLYFLLPDLKWRATA